MKNDLSNIRGHGHTAPDLFNAYLRWANGAVRLLSHSVRPTDLEELVLTRRYWSLQDMVSGTVGMTRDLVEVEIDDRIACYDSALSVTRAEFERWDARGRLVVADTSFFHHYPDKLEDADLSRVLGSRDAPVGLVIPMVVIDELERQKTSKEKHLRWRSGMTLAVIDRVAGQQGSGRLREADFSPLQSGGIPRGEHWIDVLFDVPGHTRLSIVDDEIVDRAHSLQLLSGKPVAFLTYDTNQALRARHADLADVKKLSSSEAPAGSPA